MGEKLNENIFEFIASECLLKLSGNCILEKKPFMICGMTLGWVGEVLREIQQIVCFVNINVSELALPPPIFFMLTGTKSTLPYTYAQFCIVFRNLLG